MGLEIEMLSYTQRCVTLANSIAASIVKGGRLMINLREYLASKLSEIITTWNESGIYAISFLVYTNETYVYNGHSNVAEFSISYNTETDCENQSGASSEERWNYAFWRQNETYLIEADADNEGMKVLFDWYEENGIDNIGYEDSSTCYDEKMRYIGKGPAGLYELLQEIAAAARTLQNSGFIQRKFGRPIPIIIHDLEYSWYMIDATKAANANGEATEFFAAMKELGIIDS